jgi:DNA-binding MurR/RpiR family transcriptional regulator
VPCPQTFTDRLTARFAQISPAEQRVAAYFQDHREDALILSASAIASQVGTSDATVVRTAKALGYSGLEALRKALAQEIRETASAASRMARTISEVGRNPQSAFNTTLEITRAALEDLRSRVPADLFQAGVDALLGARRVYVFGIGPSGAMAEYLALGLARLGLDTKSLVRAGMLLADDIRPFAKGDVLVLFAYGRVSREVSTLLALAKRHHMPKILITDSPAPGLSARVDMVLPVARGRIGMLSMHAATLALIEALIVGVAAQQPEASLASLEELTLLRQYLTGPE